MQKLTGTNGLTVTCRSRAAFRWIDFVKPGCLNPFNLIYLVFFHEYLSDMSFLADWCNLLKQATELYPECPPWRLIWPLFASVFAMLYAILLVTDGYLFPCFLAIGFILGAGLFSHDSPNEQLFATSMRYTGHAKQLEGTDVRDAATIKVLRRIPFLSHIRFI